MKKPRVGVVGAGRVGSVLAARLSRADYPISAVSARSAASRTRIRALLPDVPFADLAEVVRASDVVMLAVPDDALTEVISQIAALADSHLTVFHVSGRHGLAILEPLAQQGAQVMAIHPAMTFTGTEIDLSRDCVFGVTADSSARELAEDLVTDLGGTLMSVAEADRVTYHAALAHGSNHLNTLLSQAMDLLREIGASDPGAVLRPLVNAAVANTLAHGDEALTGPVVRGDVDTVDAHRDAITDANIAETYRALALATIERTAARGALNDATAADLRSVLGSGARTPEVVR